MCSSLDNSVNDQTAMWPREIDLPVPIPSAPFIKTSGTIGMYHSGSISALSSFWVFNKASSAGLNIILEIRVGSVNMYLGEA